MIKSLTYAVVLLLFACTHQPNDQLRTTAESATKKIIIKSDAPTHTFRVGDEDEQWLLDKEDNPKKYYAAVESDLVSTCIITNVDEQCFDISLDEKIDFSILYNGHEYKSQIIGMPPSVRFTEEFQNQHRGTIKVFIPEVYELMNIAIALTEYAQDNEFLVYKDSEYYKRMWRHFEPFRQHILIDKLNARIAEQRWNYFYDKMNSYSFYFDEQGNIQQSPIYRATAWGAGPNTLLPLLLDMQSFSDESSFRSFFNAEQPFYQSQIDFMSNVLDAGEMWRWLITQFPNVKAYDSAKIIFSPLVYGSQSLVWFENNGYRELQPHVNFPYSKNEKLSAKADAIWRGAILFTELNHGFINPEADKYIDRISGLFKDRALWTEPGKSSDSYTTPYAVFTEYMNWALISLYNHDQMNAEDYQIIEGRPGEMLESRGFTRGVAFDAMLTELYRNRGDSQTIADLYPAILDWCEEQIKAVATEE